MITITIRGRMVEDWDLRFAASGKAWAKARVVSCRNVRNDAGEWEEKDTTFVTVKVFGNPAEQIAESLLKGDPVTIVGRLIQENWETDSGEKRSSLVVVADEVAATVRQHQVKVTRMERTGGNQSSNHHDPGRQGSGSKGGGKRQTDPWQAAQQVDDPWAAR